jgi:hypothetical protein
MEIITIHNNIHHKEVLPNKHIEIMEITKLLN